MNQFEYSELEKQFDADTDELLNKICETFHDELKVVADKYGSVRVSLKMAMVDEMREDWAE